MDKLLAVGAVLVAGALVAAQPAANRLLSRHVGTLGAAFFSLLLSLTLIGVLLVATGHAGELRHVNAYRPEYALGGLAGVVVLTTGIYAIRTLGAGGVAAVTVAAQLIVSVLIDRYGWLGVDEKAIDLQAVGGLVLLIAGTALVTLR
jgi:transporter family-2 protein